MVEYANLPNFSGKREDWSVWSAKFLARASIIGYIDLIEGEVEIDPTSEDTNMKELKKKMNWHSVSY